MKVNLECYYSDGHNIRKEKVGVNEVLFQAKRTKEEKYRPKY